MRFPGGWDVSGATGPAEETEDTNGKRKTENDNTHTHTQKQTERG